MNENDVFEARHRLDARVAELEDQHPDSYEPPQGKVIWQGYRMFYTAECDWRDVMDGDCKHPEGWHRAPFRVRSCCPGLVFEAIRRRPDGEPGTDWTIISLPEIEAIKNCWIADRIAQLVEHPEFDDGGF